MTTRARIILLLAVVVLGALVLGCNFVDDWDGMNRSSFEDMATRSVLDEMARRQVDAEATVVAER